MPDVVAAIDRNNAQQSLQHLADATPGGQVDAAPGDLKLGERPVEAPTDQSQQHLAAQFLMEKSMLPRVIRTPLIAPSKY